MILNLSKLPNNLLQETKEALNEIKVKYSDNATLYLTATCGEKFSLSFDGTTYSIVYPELRHYFRALTLIKLNAKCKKFNIEEPSYAKEFGVMLDCCRNAVYNINQMKKIIRLLALMGYNQIQLYIEDTYEVDDEPYFGYMRGRYTKAEMKELDDYAYRFGVEIVPCIQTLAHLYTIFRWPVYESIHDVKDVILVEEERTYKLFENIFKTLNECFRTKKIHIGMDEAHWLGRGQYQDKHGPVSNRTELMLKHLDKVLELLAKYDYEPIMWSDMFFRFEFNVNYYTGNTELNFSKELVNRIPKNIKLVYWDYYNYDKAVVENMFRLHNQLERDIYFAGGAWMWTGYTPHNYFSFKTSKVHLQSCIENKCDKVFITMWGDGGGECSALSVLPSLCMDAQYMYGHEDDYEDFFKALTGISSKDYLTLDLSNRISYDKEICSNNRSKISLFNDIFLGAFDYLANIGENAIYKDHIKELARVEKIAGEYKYLFTSQKKLCEVLLIKHDLGLRLRKAYKANDKETLKVLLGEVKVLIKKATEFYKTYRKQWLKECKSIGVETQDFRLGGVILRLKDCYELLSDYLAGKVEKIEDLEQDVLTAISYHPDSVGFNYHLTIASANFLDFPCG